MERARYDQFTSIMYEHWSDILQVINRQSPRVAALLRVATPSGLKRVNGIWHVQVMIKRVVQPDRLHQPRDNEIVAQAIRLWAHTEAKLKLPHVKVSFELYSHECRRSLRCLLLSLRRGDASQALMLVSFNTPMLSLH